MTEHTRNARRLGILARIMCLIRGHQWWIDIDPYRTSDIRCCARCLARQTV